MGRTKEKAPEAYSVRITENALQNFGEITGYIAYIRHQPLNAIRVGGKIFDTIERIERNPLAFREAKEIPSKSKIYRKATCLSWNIIYKIKGSEIIVLGIIPDSRQPSKTKKLRKVK